MTTVPSISTTIMDLAHEDDHMDFGSDLPPAENDIDFDIDTMRDASCGPSAEPHQDVMIEDFTGDENVASEETKAVADDEMVDEELIEADDHNVGQTTEDANDQQSATMYDDDDLIYEDEEIAGAEEAEQVDVDFEDGDGSLVTLEDGVGENTTETLTTQVNEPQNDVQAEVNPSTDAAPDDPNLADDASEEIVPLNEEDEGVYQSTSVENPSGEEEGTAEPTARVDEDLLTGDATDLTQPSDAITSPVEEQITNTISDNPTEGNIEVAGADAAARIADSDNTAIVDSNERHDEQDGDAIYDAQPLHLVKVQYEGTEICLFPPLEGTDTYFVQDATLASSPCDQLLKACREVLGGSIEERFELVLDFPSLGLHLSEDSSYAKQLSLSQIIDVHLALCQNDQQEIISPLYSTLRSRISLASQMSYLVTAAGEGKGLSEVLPHPQTSSGDDDEGSYDSSTGQEGAVEELEHQIKGQENYVQPPDAPHASKGEDDQVEITATIATEPRSSTPNEDDRTQEPLMEGGRITDPVNGTTIESGEDNQFTALDVEADEDGSYEGDYGFSLNLCYNPQIRFCLFCLANTKTDDVHEEHGDLGADPEPDYDSTDNPPNRERDSEQTSGDVPHVALKAPESDSDQTVRGDSVQPSPAVFTADASNGIAVNDFAVDRNGVDAIAEEDTQDEFNSVVFDAPDPDGNDGHEKESSELEDPIHSKANDVDDFSSHVADDDAGPEDLLDFSEADGETEVDDTNYVAEENNNNVVLESVSFQETEVLKPTADNTTKSTRDAIDEGDINGDEIAESSGDEIDFLDEDITTNGQPTKRKARDDEEFDLFAQATPEKKKHRPS